MAQIITFIIFGGLGLMMLAVGARQYLLQRRLLTYAERVDATITYSTVFTSTSADTDPRMGRSTSTTTHRPDVRFRYSVGGMEYESDMLQPTIIAQSYASIAEALRVLEPYPVDAHVRAYVDLEHPDKGFLNAESSSAPLVFIVLGLLLPPIAWFVGRLI